MKKTLIKDLISVSMRHWRRFLVALSLVLISNTLLIANPMIFRRSVASFNMQSLPIWVIILILVSLTAAIFKYQMRLIFIEISREVEARVRTLLFDRIQRQTAAFFDRHRIGSLLSRLTNDLEAYREVMGPGIMYPLYFVTLVTPALIALYLISVPMALLTTVPILVLPFLMLILRKQTYHISLATQKALGDMSTMTQEHFAGIRIVKAYAIEKPTLKRFDDLSSHFVKLNRKLSIIRGIIYPFLGLLTKITTVLLVLFMGYILHLQWEILSTADFVSFMWIQSYLFIPVLMLGWTLPLYIQGSAAYERLVEIYNEPMEVQDKAGALSEVPKGSGMCVKELTFSYPNRVVPALHNFSLEVEKSAFIGITGPVGSGKSTLFRLLAREYEVPHGMIYFGKNEVHDFRSEAILNHLVYAEQNPFLFSASIRDNLYYGNPQATEEEIVQAVKDADLYEAIKGFPDGFDTVVGERGMTLSGGQKQRLALARSFLVDRPIVLLDDIFSAVDASTEKHIFDALKKKFRGKTVLMISHRISVLDQLDQIIYMLHGTVVEKGTPDELKQRLGYYSALVELQKL